jgi:hypothetical protein
VTVPGGGIDPGVVHPGSGHVEGAGPRDHCPPPGVAVADHQGVASVVPGVPVALHVGLYLGLERHREHPFGALPADLIEGEGELLASALGCDYPEHRRTSFRRRHHAGTPIRNRPEGTPRPSPDPASTTSVHTSRHSGRR